MTAYHVSHEETAWTYENPAYSQASNNGPIYIELSYVDGDESSDISVYRPVQYSCPATVSLANKDYQTNIPVASLEYSRLIFDKNTGIIHENASTRYGNIVRRVYGHELIKNGSLELSFPALKGASGAPVILADKPFEVVGMLVANYMSELLPVQTHTVLEEDNSLLELVNYYLPNGIAVTYQEIERLLAKLF